MPLNPSHCLTPKRVRASLLMLLVVPSLSACCGSLYAVCPPQQPPGITATENVEAFISARDQVEGLLSAANDAFTGPTVAQLVPQYSAAAAAANGWIDDATAALRAGGSYDVAQSNGKLDDVVARVRALTDAIQADAAVPTNRKAPFVSPPQDAIIDRLTASPPIVAAAEQTSNGVAAGVDAVRKAEGPVSELDQPTRNRIADTLATIKWKPAEQVLSAPAPTSASGG